MSKDEEILRRQIALVQRYSAHFPNLLRQWAILHWIKRHAEQYREYVSVQERLTNDTPGT